MKITNKKGLPDLLVRAVENDPYSPGEKTDISATTLIRPPQQVVLQRFHASDLVEDASSRIWALLGSATHSILERAAGPEDITEVRYYADALGWKISGQIDLFEKDGTLNDFKVTSVWSVKDAIESGKSDWEEQLNILAFLCRVNNLPPRKLRIIAICRDWSPSGALRDKNYPGQVESIEVPLWSPDKQHGYIEERVRLHQEAREGNYPPCTASERWEKPNSYAVKKEGRKSALRVLQTEEDAFEWMREGGFTELKVEGEGLAKIEFKKGYSIEFRQGESTRCEKYCSVRDYCQQYAEILGVNHV